MWTKPYTVQGGDSWSTISQQMYGNQRYFAMLASWNGNVDLVPGMSIEIPDLLGIGTGKPVTPQVPQGALSYLTPGGAETVQYYSGLMGGAVGIGLAYLRQRRMQEAAARGQAQARANIHFPYEEEYPEESMARAEAVRARGRYAQYLREHPGVGMTVNPYAFGSEISPAQAATPLDVEGMMGPAYGPTEAERFIQANMRMMPGEPENIGTQPLTPIVGPYAPDSDAWSIKNPVPGDPEFDYVREYWETALTIAGFPSWMTYIDAVLGWRNGVGDMLEGTLNYMQMVDERQLNLLGIINQVSPMIMQIPPFLATLESRLHNNSPVQIFGFNNETARYLALSMLGGIHQTFEGIQWLAMRNVRVGLAFFNWISKMSERMILMPGFMGEWDAGGWWWRLILSDDPYPVSVHPETGELGYWNFTGDGGRWEFTPLLEWEGLPSYAELHRFGYVRGFIPENDIYASRRWDFDRIIRNEDGTINWSVVVGRPFDPGTTLADAMWNSTGVTGLAASFFLANDGPQRWARFVELVDSDVSINEALAAVEAPGVEFIFNFITDPLGVFGLQMLSAPGFIRVGMRAATMTPGLIIGEGARMFNFLDDLILKIAIPESIPLFYLFQEIGDAMNHIAVSSGVRLLRAMYDEQGTLMRYFLGLSKMSQYEQYIQHVDDAITILARNYDETFQGINGTNLWRAALRGDEGVLNSTRISTGRIAVLQDAFRALEEGAGSRELEDILYKLGPFTDIPADARPAVIDDILHDPSISAERVGRYVLQSVQDAYARELGLRFGARGAIARAFSWVGRVLREQLLALNPSYMANNFLDNTVKTLLSRYIPNFDINAHYRIATYLRDEYGWTLAANVVQSLVEETLGMRLGGIEDLALAKLPWPLGVPEALPELLRKGFGIKIPEPIYNFLKGHHWTMNAMRRFSYAGALDIGFSFVGRIERSARANLFLQAFESHIRANGIPDTINWLRSTLGEGGTGPLPASDIENLIALFGSGNMRSIRDIDDYERRMLRGIGTVTPTTMFGDMIPANAPGNIVMGNLRNRLNGIHERILRGQLPTAEGRIEIAQAFAEYRMEVARAFADNLEGIARQTELPQEQLARAIGESTPATEAVDAARQAADEIAAEQRQIIENLEAQRPPRPPTVVGRNEIWNTDFDDVINAFAHTPIDVGITNDTSFYRRLDFAFGHMNEDEQEQALEALLTYVRTNFLDGGLDIEKLLEDFDMDLPGADTTVRFLMGFPTTSPGVGWSTDILRRYFQEVEPLRTLDPLADVIRDKIRNNFVLLTRGTFQASSDEEALWMWQDFLTKQGAFGPGVVDDSALFGSIIARITSLREAGALDDVRRVLSTGFRMPEFTRDDVRDIIEVMIDEVGHPGVSYDNFAKQLTAVLESGDEIPLNLRLAFYDTMPGMYEDFRDGVLLGYSPSPSRARSFFVQRFGGDLGSRMYDEWVLIKLLSGSAMNSEAIKVTEGFTYFGDTFIRNPTDTSGMAWVGYGAVAEESRRLGTSLGAAARLSGERGLQPHTYILFFRNQWGNMHSAFGRTIDEALEEIYRETPGGAGIAIEELRVAFANNAVPNEWSMLEVLKPEAEDFSRVSDFRAVLTTTKYVFILPRDASMLDGSGFLDGFWQAVRGNPDFVGRSAIVVSPEGNYLGTLEGYITHGSAIETPIHVQVRNLQTGEVHRLHMGQYHEMFEREGSPLRFGFHPGSKLMFTGHWDVPQTVGGVAVGAQYFPIEEWVSGTRVWTESGMTVTFSAGSAVNENGLGSFYRFLEELGLGGTDILEDTRGGRRGMLSLFMGEVGLNPVIKVEDVQGRIVDLIGAHHMQLNEGQITQGWWDGLTPEEKFTHWNNVARQVGYVSIAPAESIADFEEGGRLSRIVFEKVAADFRFGLEHGAIGRILKAVYTTRGTRDIWLWAFDFHPMHDNVPFYFTATGPRSVWIQCEDDVLDTWEEFYTAVRALGLPNDFRVRFDRWTTDGEIVTKFTSIGDITTRTFKPVDDPSFRSLLMRYEDSERLFFPNEWLEEPLSAQPGSRVAVFNVDTGEISFPSNLVDDDWDVLARDQDTVVMFMDTHGRTSFLAPNFVSVRSMQRLVESTGMGHASFRYIDPVFGITSEDSFFEFGVAFERVDETFIRVYEEGWMPLHLPEGTSYTGKRPALMLDNNGNLVLRIDLEVFGGAADSYTLAAFITGTGLPLDTPVLIGDTAMSVRSFVSMYTSIWSQHDFMVVIDSVGERATIVNNLKDLMAYYSVSPASPDAQVLKGVLNLNGNSWSWEWDLGMHPVGTNAQLFFTTTGPESFLLEVPVTSAIDEQSLAHMVRSLQLPGNYTIEIDFKGRHIGPMAVRGYFEDASLNPVAGADAFERIRLRIISSDTITQAQRRQMSWWFLGAPEPRPVLIAYNHDTRIIKASAVAVDHTALLTANGMRRGGPGTWFLRRDGRLVGSVGSFEEARHFAEDLNGMLMPLGQHRFAQMPIEITPVGDTPDWPKGPRVWVGNAGELFGEPPKRVQDSYTPTVAAVQDDALRNARAEQAERLTTESQQMFNSFDEWEANITRDFDANTPGGTGNFFRTQYEYDRAREAFNELRRRWMRSLDAASSYGIAETNRILFDYTARGSIEELLRHYAPFTTWQLRNPMFWAQLFARRPNLIQWLIKYQMWSEHNMKEYNLTERFRNTVGFNTQDVAQVIGFDPAKAIGMQPGYYGFDLSPLLSLISQFKPPFELPGSPEPNNEMIAALRRMVQFGRSWGIQPWPWISYPMELMGILPRGSTSISFGPQQRLLEAGLQVAGVLGPGQTLFGTSPTGEWLQTYWARRRVAEMEAEGLITHEQALEALMDEQSQVYQEAFRQVTDIARTTSIYRSFSPFNVKYASEGELAIREARALENLFVGDRRWWVRTEYPYLETYSLIFATDEQIMLQQVFDRYDQLMQGLYPWQDEYRELVAQRSAELQEYFGPREPVDELMQRYTSNPILLNVPNQQGQLFYSTEQAQEEVFRRLRDVEPRVPDYTNEDGTIRWDEWNRAYDDFMANIPGISESFGAEVSTNEYIMYRYRGAAPEAIAYDQYQEWRSARWDEYYQVRDEMMPGGVRYNDMVIQAAMMQYMRDLHDGFTPVEADRMYAENVSRWMLTELPYEYAQMFREQWLYPLINGQGPNLNQFAGATAELMGLDLMTTYSDYHILLDQLNFQMPPPVGMQHADPLWNARTTLYDYYYDTLTPVQQREVLQHFGWTELPDDPVEIYRAYHELLSITARASLMGEGTLMYHERNDIPIPPLSEYLDEEEIAELAQLRVEMYRYSVAREAGVYGTWTPLMTEYYGDEDSGQSQFWALLAGVSLSGSAFDDPIIAPFLNRYARTIFEYTDEQWRAARNYLIQNWDRLVDEEMTQTIRDHPEWYVLAQEQRVEFDRYRDLDMELLKAQYYAIPWGDRSDWQTENPEQWEALDSYIDRELVRAFQFPYYAYFYHNYQYTRYFGYVTPDLLNPESIPEMEEDFLQALEDLEAYLSGETNVWTVYMETFFGPSPTGSFATSPPPAPSP